MRDWARKSLGTHSGRRSSKCKGFKVAVPRATEETRPEWARAISHLQPPSRRGDLPFYPVSPEQAADGPPEGKVESHLRPDEVRNPVHKPEILQFKLPIHYFLRRHHAGDCLPVFLEIQQPVHPPASEQSSALDGHQMKTSACKKGPHCLKNIHLAMRPSQWAGQDALILGRTKKAQFAPPGLLNPGHLPPAQFIFSTGRCISGEITRYLLTKSRFPASKPSHGTVFRMHWYTLHLQLNNNGHFLIARELQNEFSVKLVFCKFSAGTCYPICKGAHHLYHKGTKSKQTRAERLGID